MPFVAPARRSFHTRCHSALAGATFALAAAAPAAGAQEGHALRLSGPVNAPVGAATTFTASGTVPADVFLNRYVNVYAIARSVVPACPATYQSALQLKDQSTVHGSETVANTVPAEGAFAVPIAYTPARAGAFLLCGYLHEGVETMAFAQHDVTAGAASGRGRPVAARRPSLARAGRRLMCRRGTWSGAPSAFTYQWRVNGKKKRGATKPTLTVTRALRGRRVSCGVTARNAAGATTALSPPRRV